MVSELKLHLIKSPSKLILSFSFIFSNCLMDHNNTSTDFVFEVPVSPSNTTGISESKKLEIF